MMMIMVIGGGDYEGTMLVVVKRSDPQNLTQFPF
jgi:hypothetical protein